MAFAVALKINDGFMQMCQQQSGCDTFIFHLVSLSFFRSSTLYLSLKKEENTVFENHRKNLILIASEASYVYNLSGQKLIKNAKNGPFWRAFENLKLAVIQCYQTGQF